MDDRDGFRNIAGSALTAWVRGIGAMLLITLFTYAALAKLLDLNSFRAQLLLQPFPAWVGLILAVVLPLAEISASVLLLFKRTLRFGFVLSFIMLFLFTGYAALALLHFWSQTPCPCGGVLGHLSWPWHLAFNATFLAITVIAAYCSLKERREGG